MNVREVREALAGLPDDIEVVVEHMSDDDGLEYRPLRIGHPDIESFAVLRGEWRLNRPGTITFGATALGVIAR